MKQSKDRLKIVGLKALNIIAKNPAWWELVPASLTIRVSSSTLPMTTVTDGDDSPYPETIASSMSITSPLDWVAWTHCDSMKSRPLFNPHAGSRVHHSRTSTAPGHLDVTDIFIFIAMGWKFEPVLSCTCPNSSPNILYKGSQQYAGMTQCERIVTDRYNQYQACQAEHLFEQLHRYFNRGKHRRGQVLVFNERLIASWFHDSTRDGLEIIVFSTPLYPSHKWGLADMKSTQSQMYLSLDLLYENQQLSMFQDLCCQHSNLVSIVWARNAQVQCSRSTWALWDWITISGASVFSKRQVHWVCKLGIRNRRVFNIDLLPEVSLISNCMNEIEHWVIAPTSLDVVCLSIAESGTRLVQLTKILKQLHGLCTSWFKKWAGSRQPIHTVVVILGSVMKNAGRARPPLYQQVQVIQQKYTKIVIEQVHGYVAGGATCLQLCRQCQEPGIRLFRRG
ncbi:hypothetical protein BS47DRAFT_1369809 [Hydnum rufescens UP504]|uniref:Uncharacterized protein n=1 Tax=Hydnum rufescens UP504 TaxID=1448309 RepID=A0A9P6DLB7_9AGAM|nr:hypothetical protein BS47DRAFT_1369809 [Hydnum rufescens UP504]